MKVLRLTKKTKLVQDGTLFSVYVIPTIGQPVIVLQSSRAEVAAKAFDHYDKSPDSKFVP